MEKAQTEAPQPVWRFLAGLQRMDLRVWSEDGRLRVSAPPGVLTPKLREELAARKVEVSWLFFTKRAYPMAMRLRRCSPYHEVSRCGFPLRSSGYGCSSR